MIPVWIVRSHAEIKWYYAKPPKLPKGSEIEEQPIWHYRGWYVDNGTPVCDNKWISANDLRADGGWKEIEAALSDLCPEAKERFDQWNRAGAPEASHFFRPIDEKEAT